jgi:hypothetical protein
MPPADESAASAPNPALASGDDRRTTQPTLHTARLTLVPLTDEHLELEAGLDSDAEVMRYLTGRALSRAEAAFLRQGCGGWVWRFWWRRLAIRGTLGIAETWAAHGGLDAAPVDLCVTGSGAGRCRLRLGGRTRPGGPASPAVPGGRGGRGIGRPVAFTVAHGVPVPGGVRVISARP